MEQLKALYPNLSPEELTAAKENLDQYLLLAWELWETEQATLTDKEATVTILGKVDSPTNY